MKLSHAVISLGALLMASFAFASGGEPANLECSWGGKYYFDMPFKYGTNSPRTIDGDVTISQRGSNDALGTIHVTGDRFATGLSIKGKNGKNSLALHMTGNLPQSSKAVSDVVYHGDMHLVFTSLSDDAQGNDIPVRCNMVKGQE